MYEGLLKVMGDFSAVLPICGGLILFCWKSEVMTDLMRNTESDGIKGYSTFFLEIRSFYNSPRVKLLSFTFFEFIQPISGSGTTTFSIA